jgi:hypothetical protein
VNPPIVTDLTEHKRIECSFLHLLGKKLVFRRNKGKENSLGKEREK